MYCITAHRTCSPTHCFRDAHTPAHSFSAPHSPQTVPMIKEFGVDHPFLLDSLEQCPPGAEPFALHAMQNLSDGKTAPPAPFVFVARQLFSRLQVCSAITSFSEQHGMPGTSQPDRLCSLFCALLCRVLPTTFCRFSCTFRRTLRFSIIVLTTHRTLPPLAFLSSAVMIPAVSHSLHHTAARCLASHPSAHATSVVH